MVAVLFVGAAQAKFLHGIVIAYDNNSWYMAGPADGPNGEKDIPAHEWVQTGKDKLRGKHLNTGPFGASKWWSSDAPDGEYLYNVDGIIDVWTSSAAQDYANKGTYITTSSSRHPTA